jgi:hypothetical protein
MIWYSIILYYIPNNKWKIPMLNLMSGGSQQKRNTKKNV